MLLARMNICASREQERTRLEDALELGFAFTYASRSCKLRPAEQTIQFD